MLDPGPERRTSTLAGLMEPLQRAPHLNLAFGLSYGSNYIASFIFVNKTQFEQKWFKKVIKQKAYQSFFHVLPISALSCLVVFFK